MSFVQKEWKNRISEQPHRRQLTNINTGEIITVDVERSEGTILQEGDAFNADNMNDLEQRIADNIGGLLEIREDIPATDRNPGALYFIY